MDDLFGTDSDNSDGEMKISSQPSQLPSTQQHMEDLFGESDEDNVEQQQQSPAYERANVNQSDDDSDGNYHTPQDDVQSDDEARISRDIQHNEVENVGVKNNQSDEEEEQSDTGGESTVLRRRARTTSYESGGTPVHDDSDDDNAQHQQSGGGTPVPAESDDDNTQRQISGGGTPVPAESDDDNAQRQISGGGTPVPAESDDDNTQHQQSGGGTPVPAESDDDNTQHQQSGGGTPVPAESDDDNAQRQISGGGTPVPAESDDDNAQHQQSGGGTPVPSDGDDNLQLEQNRGSPAHDESDDDDAIQRQLSNGSPLQDESDDDNSAQNQTAAATTFQNKNDHPNRVILSDDENVLPRHSDNDSDNDEMNQVHKEESDEEGVRIIKVSPPYAEIVEKKWENISDGEEEEGKMQVDERTESGEAACNQEKDRNVDDDAFFKEMAEDQDDSEDEIMFRRKVKTKEEDTQDAGDDENSGDGHKLSIAAVVDSDDEGEKQDVKDNIPTQEDLFGEDIDVSSDDDEAEPEVTKKPMIEDDDDDEVNEKRSEEADDDETGQEGSSKRPLSPAKEEEGLSISIELPRCNISLGKELNFIKLPNFLSVDTKPFDSNFYEDEIDEDEVIDEEGKARLKLKVENTIRWRYSKDKDGNEIKESNCRFVRWSDGSITMHLGNEVFDVFKMPIEGETNHLFVQQGTGLQAQAVFKNKLSFRPQSTSSQTHQKMILSIADRMSKAQKIKMMPATDKDPENQREHLLKKEEENLRAAVRREAIQRKTRERNAHKTQLTSNYLDQDMADEEDDLDTSLAAIKNRYKQDKLGKSTYNQIYSSDEDDSEPESKTKKAKIDSSSDEEQKKQETKKKTKKVIEESDEEEGSGSDDENDDDKDSKEKAKKGSEDDGDNDDNGDNDDGEVEGDDKEPKKKVKNAIESDDSDDDGEGKDIKEPSKPTKKVIEESDDDDSD